MTSRPSSAVPSLPSVTATGPGASVGGASMTSTTEVPAVAPSDPPVPTEMTSVSSAAGGATSLRKKKRQRDRKIVTPQMEEQMAAMRAAGMSELAVARSFPLSRTCVRDHLAKPELQAIVEKHRAMFRALAAEQAAGIVHKAFTRAEQALDENDAKGFDAYTRGIRSLESSAASVAGENKPGAVNVAVGVGIQMAPEERDELMAAFRKTVVEQG